MPILPKKTENRLPICTNVLINDIALIITRCTFQEYKMKYNINSDEFDDLDKGYECVYNLYRLMEILFVNMNLIQFKMVKRYWLIRNERLKLSILIWMLIFMMKQIIVLKLLFIISCMMLSVIVLRILVELQMLRSLPLLHPYWGLQSFTKCY